MRLLTKLLKHWNKVQIVATSSIFSWSSFLWVLAFPTPKKWFWGNRFRSNEDVDNNYRTGVFVDLLETIRVRGSHCNTCIVVEEDNTSKKVIFPSIHQIFHLHCTNLLNKTMHYAVMHSYIISDGWLLFKHGPDKWQKLEIYIGH